jgi:hypothetical protein
MKLLKHSIKARVLCLLVPISCVMCCGRCGLSLRITRDSRLKSAFLKALETIKSDYERGRVLSVLLKNKQIS